MGKFKISKKWSRKGKLLRAIINGTLGNNVYFDKVHDNGDHHECMEAIKDDKKPQEASVFCKVGLVPSLVRVPSRGLNELRKLGRVVSMRKYEGRQEECGSDELCKKRIIMGKKCRPLNVSGSLHYDKNGVLVPEEFVSSFEDSLVLN
ncbi:hypothetical protein Tco_0299195 [Tanacetum coccineum]